MKTLEKNPNVVGEKDVFEFNEATHRYKLNGQSMTGVTTILGVIAKPALIQWSANMAVEYIQAKILGGESVLDNLAQWLTEAKSAHRLKKEDAGDKGKYVHAEIERLIKEVLEGNKGMLETDLKHENAQVQHFIDWAIKNKVKFLASEERLYSKEWFVAGTCDFLCEIDGNLWLGDIKTSSAIYPEHFFQTSAYQKMYEEMGLRKNFMGNLILNVRKDGEFEEKRSISNEDNLLAFQSALNLYRVQQKLQGTII